jgi:hypothetical protein
VKFPVHLILVILLAAAASSFAAATATSAPPAAKSGKQIVFEEQRIEGKLRRPQLVLIKADMRPEFPPMIIQGFSKGANILDFIDESIIEDSPYKGAFQFEGKKIRNYAP